MRLNYRKNWILLAAAAATLTLAIAGCGGEGGGGGAPPLDESKFKTTPSGLKYSVTKPGTGDVAKKGNVVKVQYTGWLMSTGAKFDSSRDRNEPFEFPLGASQVIAGWDEGVEGMKEGEVRELIIPPTLGYGESGTPGGPIPGNATLRFEVELVDAGSGSAGGHGPGDGHNH
jgi:FKBP-type peptidyl-prolyl cis-trans isomerase FkpA